MALFGRTSRQPQPPDRMVGFGPGTGWMAIRDRSQAEVADFFALSSPRACPWLEGVSASAKGGVVAVTPPLSGVGGMWTLVTGSVLLFTPEQTSLVSELLVTEVHYYATDRRLGRLYWCRADDDKRVEGAARMAGVEGDDQQAEDDAMAVLDETSLTSLAGQYSLDPTTLVGQPADGPLLVGGVGVIAGRVNSSPGSSHLRRTPTVRAP